MNPNPLIPATIHERITTLENDFRFLNAVANVSDWHDLMEDLNNLYVKSGKMVAKYAAIHDPHGFGKMLGGSDAQ